MDEILQAFLVECRELLDGMEAGLLRVEQEDDTTESVNAIFRAAHTIKGSAGLVGLDGMVAFTHVMESVLDRVRAGELGIDGDLVAVLLDCGDHLARRVDLLAGGGDDSILEEEAGRIQARLAPYQRGAGSSLPAPVAATPVNDRGAAEHWHISLRFGPDVLRNGMDPLSFLRFLGTLGDIVGLHLIDRIPPAAEMDPETCYLGFEIGFRSAASKADIEAVFEFVQDDCVIHILPPASRIEEYLELIRSLPEDDFKLGEILVRCGTLTQHELAEALARQAAAQDAGAAAQAKPLGEIILESGMVQPAVLDAALEKQKQGREAKSQENRVLKVDSEKLDHLINLVGELVIAGASAAVLAQRSRDMVLQETTSNIARLVEEIRDSALQLRMVQIGETFRRFNRVVRDVSRELGKEIELVITGAETELDKTVVDKIGDPLTHLVRNSMDHGIEATEARIARGKPARGTVRLNAYHDSGNIVIEVGDDGNGLNRERILAKAQEKGLVQAGQTLGDQEVYQLIFEPGFSTAAQVTNLSGRGVGMDVVRRNIEALRGTIEIDSREGEGSTFRIRLPLTLAIIDGFLFGVGSASYVVPLDMVVECVELTDADRLEAGERNFVNLRGELLPFLRLREYFSDDSKAVRRENIVVVQHAGQKAGLVVDALMGEFQTVIKPLGQLFGHLKGISGSTILGSGEVALIMDVPALIQRAVNQEERRHAVPASV
ncbi:MAG TPA: chemotaxis protein CheA [Parasulfuritortus sp.]